ncbi:MAG: regulatory iron-sulfur-containing complex subunit RicT [Planctomycetota bacterium]
MPITPLPQFEADLKELEEDRKAYEALKAPKTLVVRFGALKMVGEFPYKGDAKPGCGSKIVVRTHRGTEIGEMLTSTCPNSGCSKSVTRKQMLDYISNSGGKDYPFFTDGRALRVATMEDMDHQARLEQSRHGLKLDARARADRLGVTAQGVKIVDAEPLLGGERIVFYYASEERADLRELSAELVKTHNTKIDFKQVGARDEARITADYEKCGQYCCCKNFLKVLKPVSMKSAKTQKATLDPMKISGRCGRLMCCLRYEDETYEALRKRLPNKKKKVGTPEGDGIVVETQILTQLVLVSLDGTHQKIAVPVEDITEPTGKTASLAPAPAPNPEKRKPRPKRSSHPSPSRDRPAETEAPPETGEKPKKKRRRRRRKPAGEDQASGGGIDTSDTRAPETEQKSSEPHADAADGPAKKKRRRRRRRKPGSNEGGGGSSTGPASDG